MDEAAGPGPADPALLRAEQIRSELGLAPGDGPPAANIRAAIEVYVRQYTRWYHDQWAKIIPKYHRNLVQRINPFVRRAQHGDCSALALATAVVNDWASRNFVTAGGQALEALAIALGPQCQKAVAEGIDLQRADPADPSALHLYVLKSGGITRNTDIVNSMKTNLRKAERLARQNDVLTNVRLNYATCVGSLRTTLADGVHRPSSARFWSEVTGLDEDNAVRLVWAITNEGASQVSRLDRNRRALVALLARYLEKPGSDGEVDWLFLVRSVTEDPKRLRAENRERHEKAFAEAKRILDEDDAASPN